MIASVGQKTDTKVPETITAVSGLASNLTKLAAADTKDTVVCSPEGKLYPIVGGVPSKEPVGVYSGRFARPPKSGAATQ